MTRLYDPDEIYRASFVRGLFDEMSQTYGIVNTLSSFGFCWRWRRQCVELAALEPGMVVVDLMSGSGECWPTILRHVGSAGRIHAIDFSSGMCEQARRRAVGSQIEVRQEDALESGLSDECADAVVACFALKTLMTADVPVLAQQVRRIIKPGGRFSLLEISVPKTWRLRPLFMAYLKYAIPIMGRLFLGNPDNYRMLGRYTERFGDCSAIVDAFASAGLAVELRHLFFGCATAVIGHRLVDNGTSNFTA